MATKRRAGDGQTKSGAAAERQQRLSKALRDNLAKRKAQSRAQSRAQSQARAGDAVGTPSEKDPS